MRIERPTDAILDEAAQAIANGELVVLPTETVYGLACNALNPEAVRAVFKAKGRPDENPLIVHISTIEDIGKVASGCNGACKKLADRFWPGPLTMVLKKLDAVPNETTAGLGTVAVRVPSHPVALEVIRRAQVPVAAPSANVFMSLSPTSAEDVDPNVAESARLVIDGGHCEYGLESTVIDLSEDQPRILRPGAVTRAEIQAVLGMPLGQTPPHNGHLSPGMYPRHYAPSARLVIVDKVSEDAAGLTFEDPAQSRQVKMPHDAKAYAANLYRALKRLDALGVSEIQVESPPNTAEWEAVLDRLKKAATQVSP